MMKNKKILSIIGLWYILFISIIGCGYSFRDAAIPPNIKTIKIGFFDNRASYINPILSARLTDQFQQFIAQQTKLTRTNSDNAQYQVSGYISNYSVTTTGVSNQQVVTNQLNVTVHVSLYNAVDDKTTEADVSRSYPFSANLTLQQVEPQLIPTMVSDLSNDMYNKLFSNW